MNTLSSLASLSPPAFADLSLHRAEPAAAPPAWFDSVADSASVVLHVSPGARPQAIDDIERDFVNALCESRPA